eukprot:CAMPEP_0170536150 /NCGR_PEP_ID=MMETSP0209-20121228/101989_1 /TAXON_ID=665100 ORGANISM="Litonotus pictus, Strain P1" /NCGR_SAMPLE_ID=MMETSP0209 /ASSEMBLY_ACC=CAM_ASM_000301 /LENGTH=201 /DNA_ID=CAMNT_0010837487 /DNA_START=711 /DNA_END=1313 /DNA_ORIENTATION=-
MKFLGDLVSRLNSELISKHKEQILNLFEDYYPVEFSPPKNSPIKITQEDLSDSLNQAIFANSILIKDVYDMMKERVDTSEVVEGKFEVLKSVCYLFNNMLDKLKNITNKDLKIENEVKNLNIVWEDLFNLIVSEIINNIDEEVHFEAIKALTLSVKYNKATIDYILTYGSTSSSNVDTSLLDTFLQQQTHIYDLLLKSCDW